MKIFRRYFNPLAEMVITRMLLKMSLIHMFSNVLLVLIKFKMMTILTMTMMAKMMLLKMMVVIVLKMSLDRTLPQWATGPAHLGTGLGEPLDRLVLGRRPVPARPGRLVPDCRLPGSRGRRYDGRPSQLTCHSTAVSQRLQPRRVPSSSSPLLSLLLIFASSQRHPTTGKDWI